MVEDAVKNSQALGVNPHPRNARPGQQYHSTSRQNPQQKSLNKSDLEKAYNMHPYSKSHMNTNHQQHQNLNMMISKPRAAQNIVVTHPN